MPIELERRQDAYNLESAAGVSHRQHYRSVFRTENSEGVALDPKPLHPRSFLRFDQFDHHELLNRQALAGGVQKSVHERVREAERVSQDNHAGRVMQFHAWHPRTYGVAKHLERPVLQPEDLDTAARRVIRDLSMNRLRNECDGESDEQASKRLMLHSSPAMRSVLAWRQSSSAIA